jgi:hypothetical protein
MTGIRQYHRRGNQVGRAGIYAEGVERRKVLVTLSEADYLLAYKLGNGYPAAALRGALLDAAKRAGLI